MMSFAHGSAELILKVVILPKVIYRFSAVPHQDTSDIVHRTRKAILEFIEKHKRPRITKAILTKSSNAGSTTTFNFKISCKTIVTKTARYWYKKRDM